jgi:hypothetical protein
MKKILSCLSLWFILFGSSFAYSPTENDFLILDKIENKVFELVEDGKIEPETFISKVETLLEENEYSERIEFLLNLLIEGMQYDYMVENGDEFEMSIDDCYDDEVYNTKLKVCLPNYSVYYEDGLYGQDYEQSDWEEGYSEDEWYDYGDEYGEHDNY